MTERASLINALMLCITLLVPCMAAAQQEEEEDTGSREVEISEDNYRRFMELDDQPIERAMPIMQAPSQAGLENMQRLPEASQKHLREQLREIILGSGAWTPASMNNDYPFVPSEAARSDAGLRQLEAAAWGELVAQYHAREAEIQAARQAGAAAMQNASMQGQNSSNAGQNAGNSAGQNAGGQAGGQQGQAGAEGQQGSGQQGQDSSSQASEQARRQAQSQPDSSRPRPGQSQYRPPPEGSEQSALEFLTGQTAGDGQPARNTGNRQATGRLTLEQLEQVRGIGQISTEPLPPQEEPADANDERKSGDSREGDG